MQVRINTADYDDVETVQATLTRKAGGGAEWVYEPAVHLAAGDALETPPPNMKMGQTVSLRVVRGYLPLVGATVDDDVFRGRDFNDDRTPEELADAGITIRIDEKGKRHIRMVAEPHIELTKGPAAVTCACGEGYIFTESGSTHGWIPPHGDFGWSCPECAKSLQPHVVKA